MNRRFYFLVLIVFYSSQSIAQIRVIGRVVDDQKQSIPFVTISFQSKTISSRLEGTFSDIDGRFNVELTPDKYTITFQMIGYENAVIEQVVKDDTDLGRVLLTENVRELDEVIVRAERSHIESDLGKKILYVGADLANAGSTAVDALESLPAVSTTLDGSINVRGSENVIIYVNGRETKRDPKSLQFVSADALQKIELITNPSAKYDAEGVAGIINLVYNKTS
ncbi:MAG: carboxypeptidase-like regulatory domain-containing protein, partial [Bacteroidota bacterium]